MYVHRVEVLQHCVAGIPNFCIIIDSRGRSMDLKAEEKSTFNMIMSCLVRLISVFKRLYEHLNLPASSVAVLAESFLCIIEPACFLCIILQYS